jgi:aspartate/methionine/tyrosine aminotransferase
VTPPAGSRYLRWAKLHRPPRFDLTSSGLPHLEAADLPAALPSFALGGTGAYGFGALGDAIAARYRVPGERVVQALGCSMANFLAISALVGAGDEVVIEHPTYEPLLSVARHLGASIRRFPRRAEDGFAIDPAEVARAVTARTRLIVITNLHNPSGALTDDDTLREIGRIAEAAGARVLVDEVYLDALFERWPRTSAHLGDVFIATSSLTKVYGLAGLRCGWILAEPRLACRMWRMVEITNNIGAHPAEQIAAAAFTRMDVLIARSMATLGPNRDALNAFYRARGDLEWTEHRAGTVAFPRLRRGGVRRLRHLLVAEGETDIVHGAFFGLPDHFRIGLGARPADFAAGLEHLGRALDRLDPSP